MLEEQSGQMSVGDEIAPHREAACYLAVDIEKPIFLGEGSYTGQIQQGRQVVERFSRRKRLREDARVG
jgi:hypothetical protein